VYAVGWGVDVPNRDDRGDAVVLVPSRLGVSVWVVGTSSVSPKEGSSFGETSCSNIILTKYEPTLPIKSGTP
jgi:hypothetical protein